VGNFVKIARVEEIPEGTGKQIDVDGKSIALFNIGNCFYAIEAWCFHMGAPLADSDIRGTRIVCPWHRWEFDLTTGCYTRDRNKRLDCYPVKVEDGNIFAQL
jgi:nitrite reductase/ring-hydroxylating ferredoxin subunit